MLALFFGAGTNTLQAFTRCFLYLSGVAVSPYDRSFSFTLQTERIQMPVFKSGKGQAPARCEMEYEEQDLLLVLLRVGLDEVVEMRAETLPQR